MLRKFPLFSFNKLLFNLQLKFTSSKLIRDHQQLTQNQINSILGLDTQQQSINKKITSNNTNSTTIINQQQQKSIGKVRDLFYNLIPTKNQNFPICIDPQEIIIQQTPNQNIFQTLQLSKDCSYDQYSNALSYFRTQTDLYGDQLEKTQIKLEDLQFKQLLKFDSPYIEKARERFLVNISIPGSIQVQDPRNFMQLRPIEQFRHTPLIPISQSAMKKHKQMLQEYHRRQFIFEVKTQSVVNFVLIVGSVGLCGYLVYLALQKQQERTVAYSRLKFKRTMGEEADVKFKI